MHFLFEPGLWANSPVRIALIVGTCAALSSAVVGVFVVMRGQAFAGHALTDVTTTGGAGSFLFGLSPLLGFVGAGVLGAGAMELVGTERVRNRDIATGLVLSVATGAGALFLYLDATRRAVNGAPQSVLFGSIFTLPSSVIPLALVASSLCLLAISVLYRPLVMSSVNPEFIRLRGIPGRGIGVVFMLVMALAVGLSAVAVGSILSTALLIGPAAAAIRLATTPGRAITFAVAIGLLCTWFGVVFAYDSFYWFPSTQGLPVSFFIVMLVVAVNATAMLRRFNHRRHREGH